jgi:hypothetical protein
MESGFKPRSLPEAVFAEGVPSNLDHKTRHQLEVGLRRLDDLAREDPRTGEVYVDEQRLRGVLKRGLDKPNINKVIGALKELPDAALRSRSDPNAKRVPWEGIARRAVPSMTQEASEHRRPPMTLTTTPEELRRMVQEQRPDLPDHVFDPGQMGHAMERLIAGVDSWQPGADTRSAESRAANPFQVLWDCLVSTIGFWVALAIIGFVYGVVLAILGAFPFFSVLLWGLIVALQGFAYALVLSVVGCVFTALLALLA